MSKSPIKKEAMNFFTLNNRVWLKDFDDPLTQINDLYESGAKKVWVVDEYDEGEGLERPDTLYIDVDETINTNLLISICNLKPDECSFSDDGKSIRLWWD